MMEEKKGLVDFLRSNVGCFKDLPRGHIINLAQHMQQVALLVFETFQVVTTSIRGHFSHSFAQKQLFASPLLVISAASRRARPSHTVDTS